MPIPNILMLVAPENFRDEELLEPKEVFEDSGYRVSVASKGVKSASGMLGAQITIDLDIQDVNVEDFDAVVFVGGSGASIYFNDSGVLRLAREAYEKGRVVAAICIAPSILANAGLLEGKRATSYPSEEDNLRQKGATYTGAGTETDGRIVTGKGPQFAGVFGEKVIAALSE